MLDSSCVDSVVIVCVCVVGLACALCWGKNITPGPRWAHSIKGEGAVI